MHVPYVVKKRYGSQTVANSVPVKALSASGLFCVSYYHVDCIYCTLDKKRLPCGHCAKCKAPKCGRCKFCLRPSLKQACVQRQCISLHT